VLIVFNKPYGVLSQFSSDGSAHRTLAQFGFPSHVHPIGRLDADSEGLLLLSDEPALNAQLLHPRRGHRRLYWVQVEGLPTAQDLRRLSGGIVIQGRKTLPCRAWRLEPQPSPAPRVPPIRFRKTVLDCWIAIELTEGKNRQVRRMTAAVGHPALRLIRVRIGNYEPRHLASGQWRVADAHARELLLAK
jgi:23S rRNA pseudouridine2457 synthase